jgi:glutathione synthase/RimK-type ligase-like ATP-grasp enzyme
MAKLAFVGYKAQEKYLQGVTNDEDADVLTFLKAKGLQIDFVIWNDESIDWNSYDVVIIKSPWDYHEKIDAFYTWLEELKKLSVKVLNPVDIIKWNSNKHYLDDILKKGLNVIPSAYLLKGEAFSDRFFDVFAADELVVKPCVSAGAKNTITVNKNNMAEKKAMIDALLLEEDYLVQPFMKEIKEGEWSFLFFNGKYSHSVLKTPKEDDFRVQHYHGGRISHVQATASQIMQAEAFLNILPEPTLYARVDGVMVGDSFYLMELELIEPYLFLNGDATLLTHYYEALLECI